MLATKTALRCTPMPVSLDDKYTLTQGRAYLSGIDALVRLLLLQRWRDQAAGVNTAGFVSGYRGSPLGGLDSALWEAAEHLKNHHIHFQPAVNEELAATSIWGSQQLNLFPGARYDGVFGLWYGKGPGLDRAMDPLKHANNSGTSRHGGVLAVVGDDHLCKSSTLAFQSEAMFIAATVPVLNPGSIQDVLDLGLHGWAMSRFAGCWVGMKTTADNMDASASADMALDRVRIVLPEDFAVPEGGLHARWPDQPLAQEARLQGAKLQAVLAYARANRLDRVVLDGPRPRFGIAAAGKAYLDTRQALADLGIDAALAEALGLRLYKVAMPWPLEPTGARAFAEGLDEILVVEEKRGLIEEQLKTQLYALPDGRRPRILGKHDAEGRPLFSPAGELNPTLIARAILARLQQWPELAALVAALRAPAPDPAATLGGPLLRQPWFCSGCPHNTSTKVPEGSRAMAGIGCHYMVTWMDRDTETFTQMGGEGAAWIGQAPFTDTPHVFQNIGDGTYFHSGILAVRAAVSAGVNMTYKILYNDAVAMTGGQHVDGSLTVEQLIQQLVGEGVQRIDLVSDDPEKYADDLAARHPGLSIHHRDRLDAVQKELRELSGTTVIIYDQVCATELRRRRKRGLLPQPQRRVFINERVCEGCGDCGVQSNCLSVVPVETPLGRKRAIDQSSCNKDYSCLKGFCPSFVSVHGGSLRRLHGGNADADFPALPEPQVPTLTAPFSILLPGVGGMGVLTIGGVMGMAAHLEGRGALVMTQTGLAQKFGAVTAHVRIAPHQDDIHAHCIPQGGADLLLGADLVVASGREALARLAPGAVAVVNSHESPTADFTHDPDAAFPGSEMEAVLRGATTACHFVDASALAAALMGDAIAANFFLLGYAWQRGLVPLGATALTDAIRLNAVAVETNLKAFLWGRRYAADPARVRRSAGIEEIDYEPPRQTLDELIAERERMLTDYQNAGYGARYRALVVRVRDAEARLGTRDFPLTTAVARGYHKLLAYKDEYEVARFYTDGEFEAELERQFEGDYRLSFHLAPPLLARRDPDTGRLQKREFGAWMLSAFRLLAKFRFLRGTPFDPFGYTAERRMERQVIADYEARIAELIADLDADNHALAVEIAGLPEFIRGFGHVKEANLATVRRREVELVRRFHARDRAVVQIQPAPVAVDA
ncbi:MAG: indolepyruvate ferredoxin oxidoreductase family protein [Porticoccaceae bacterium]